MNCINILKISFFIIAAFIFSGCNNIHPEKINPTDVKEIYFGSLPPGEETIFPLSNFSEVMNSMHYRDTTITDRKVIDEYSVLINNLKTNPRAECNIDMRVISIIKMEDGNIRKIGYGYKWSILYDGILMRDDPEVFSFLQRILYTPHPLTYWLTEEEKIALTSLKETE